VKRLIYVAAFLSCLANFALAGFAQPASPDIAAADTLFQAGKFVEAENIYAQIAKLDAKSYPAALKLANIALLSNRLDSAIEWSHRALAIKPDDTDARIILAEALYRENKFAEAGATIGSAEVEAEADEQSYRTLDIAQLKSFARQTPYQFEGTGQVMRLKFVNVKLLPLLTVRVNGGREAVFFLDTGGSELLLDTAFAKELGVKAMGSVTGVFAGDQTAPVGNGRVDSLTLGGWTLKNVPAGMLPLRSMSASFGVKQIDGCVGTSVLYQFLATIDYPAGELVLRRKTPANLKAFDAALLDASSTGKHAVVMPMWMAGDHFMVTWGQVNSLPPAQIFVDSGLAGAGVKLAESTIKAAGITLEQNEASAGMGGGGRLITIPYTVKKFSLGAVTEENVPGLYDGPFPFGNSWGFHVDGMVGNDFLKSHTVTLDFTGMRLILQ